MFGSSLLVVVWRLAVALAPVGGAERAERSPPPLRAARIMRHDQTALERLKAWWKRKRRVPVDGRRAHGATQHSGLSAEFLRALGQTWDGETEAVFSAKTERCDETRGMRRWSGGNWEAGIHHVVLLPIQGKKSTIGYAGAGVRGPCSHRRRTEFLERRRGTGMAGGESRLQEQVTRRSSSGRTPSIPSSM